MDPGQPQSEVIGLGSGVDKEANGERLRECLHQSLGEDHDLIMKVPVVCGDQGHLVSARLDHVRVAMANCIEQKVFFYFVKKFQFTKKNKAQDSKAPHTPLIKLE